MLAHFTVLLSQQAEVPGHADTQLNVADWLTLLGLAVLVGWIAIEAIKKKKRSL